MHKVYYQPEGIWVGDIMPYGEDGTFYLYHQRDTRNPGPFGEPFGWALATTKDFVNYKDFGESLERGGDEEVDQYVYAGTVFKVGDKYHALYTGCNRDKVKARLMKQVLLHATSDDAVKWEKNIAETLLPPQEGYDDRNWRDPFVLWDEAVSYTHLDVYKRQALNESSKTTTSGFLANARAMARRWR